MATRCWELDGASRFDGRATLYARGRPSYPDAVIDYIAANVVRNDPCVADLGAGTGISTRLLAQRFPRTIAFDPNLEMARAAGTPPLRFVLGKTESLPFRTASLDLVTSFNSFHWFVPERAMPEIDRVLRPDGRFVVVWNDWDLGDPFTAEFVALMRSAAQDYPPEDRDAEVAPLLESRRFGSIEMRNFPNVHRMDRDGLRIRLQSMSFVPIEGPEAARLLAGLERLHAAFADAAGLVEHRYVTSAYVAKR